MTKQYVLKIKTHGPVHIGSGQKLNRLDYIFNPRKSSVSIINGMKFIQFLKNQNKLDAYTTYMRSHNPRQLSVFDFLKKENIHENKWMNFVDYEENLYKFKKLGSDNGRKIINSTVNDIDLFIRDGRNEAYIPGSSLKGALRLAIDPEGKLNKDVFKYLSVSDSTSISNDRLAVYQKIDMNKAAKPMPLYRECIMPNTEIECTLSLDESFPFSCAEIEKKIKLFYIHYWNKWLFGILTGTPAGKEFIKFGGITPDTNAKNKPTALFIGGGAGFVSKTSHYQTEDKQKAQKDIYDILAKKYRGTYGKMKEQPKNVPVVLKAAMDHTTSTYYQQGIVTLSFEEKE